MKSDRRKIQVAILVVGLLLGAYAVGQSLFASSEFPEVGDKPPAFSLLDMDGKTHNLSDYEGKPLVINFWGTFCPPCVKEMPEFQRQYEKWKGEGLEILAVNLSEDDLTVKTFLQRFKLDYVILRDKNRLLEREFGVRSYPTTYFVSRDGTIREIFIGGMTEEDIDERVSRLLKS